MLFLFWYDDLEENLFVIKIQLQDTRFPKFCRDKADIYFKISKGADR